MDVHSTHIPSEEFARFIAQMPQVCVEVVLRTPKGVLLGKRTNEPARGEWFWPGGRLYKGEKLEEAAHRIAAEELGVEIEIVNRLGVHSHFWERSSLPGAPSRHTVNVVFLVEPANGRSIELNDEHSTSRFVEGIEDDFHEYVRLYFDEYDLP